MITTKMRTYEVLVVFNPNTQDDVIQERLAKIEDVAKKHNGKVDKKEVWGRRSLAYPISNYKYGLFVAINVSGESTLVTELNRQLQLMDEVLRTFVTTKNQYSPDLDGRLKSDFTYGYRPPQSQFAAKALGLDEEEAAALGLDAETTEAAV